MQIIVLTAFILTEMGFRKAVSFLMPSSVPSFSLTLRTKQYTKVWLAYNGRNDFSTEFEFEGDGIGTLCKIPL